MNEDAGRLSAIISSFVTEKKKDPEERNPIGEILQKILDKKRAKKK